MKVGDVMKSKPSLCRPEDRLVEAGNLMAEVGCGALPVVDSERRLLGMLTDRDVCCAVARSDRKPSEMQVAEAMTAPARSCRAEDPIHQALETMQRYRVRRLPVIDAERRVEGVLSLDDIAAQAHATASDATDLTWRQVGEALQAISGHPVLARI